jgi:hypothetical protein
MTTTAKETDRRDNNLLGRLIGLGILIALYLIVCMWLRPAIAPGMVAALTATATRAAPTATPPPPTAPTLAAPTVEAIAANAVAGPLTLTGTGAPGSSVQIVIDGQVAGEATVGADGKWSFPTELEAGEHRLIVNALNAAGQVAASAPQLSFALGAALSAPTLDPVAANAVAGPLTLTGTGTPGSTVQILIEGQVAGEATVGADGKWTFPTTLAAGNYRIEARALDAAGAAAATSEPLSLSLGAAAGAVTAPTLDAPTGPLFTGPLTLTGTGTPNSKVQIVIGGQPAGEATVGADGKWSFDADLPNAGAVPVVVNALDANGQVAASSPSADLDIAALTLDPLAASYRPGPVTLTGTGAPGSRVRIVIDGQPAGEVTVGADGKWTFNANFARAGNYAIAVSALDANGQVVATSEPATARVQAAAAATPAPSVICDYSDPTVYGEDQGTTWLVDRCDTMSYIARQTGIPLDALIAANPQIRNPDIILPGWRVNLPGR